MDLGQMLQSSATINADRSALWVDECFFSYRELLFEGCGIANAIAGLRRRRTAVFANRHFWSYASIVGAVIGGHAYVPLNPHHPQGRLVTVMRSADVGAFVLDQESLPVCRNLIEQTPPMLVIIPDGKAPDWAAKMPHQFIGRDQLSHEIASTSVAPDDGAYLLFTSGSTGTPKGVMVDHENVLAYLLTVLDRYRLTTEDRATQLFDLTFDLSVHDLFVTWASGATLFCPPELTRKAPRRFVQQRDLTCWFSTPATIAFMARLRMLHADEFPSLRLSLFCGEALPTPLARLWMQAAPNSVIENLYGPTEATIAVTAFRLPASLEGLPEVIPIGHPFPGQEARIVNDELIIGGSQVTNGYWRDVRQTAEKFVRYEGRQWYATGDRVRQSDHGLCFLGRLDRQVKILGNRVELFEVEGALREAARCDSAAAIASPIRDGVAQGITAFVPDEGRVSNSSILDECRRRLPPYMVPSRLIRLRDWPLNSNGKTDYLTLESIVASDEV
jgi:amino acid adenylation domain-containing protein